MSMRPCNYCEYERLKKWAETRGWGEVVVKPAPKIYPESNIPDKGFPDGVDVFVVDTERGEGEIWMMWFAELPDHCCC